MNPSEWLLPDSEKRASSRTERSGAWLGEAEGAQLCSVLYVLRHPFSGPLKLKLLVRLSCEYPAPEHPTGRKKRVSAGPAPTGKSQEQGQLNQFAAVRFAPIYQGPVTRARPSRLGLRTKKKFSPAERPDLDGLS